MSSYFRSLFLSSLCWVVPGVLLMVATDVAAQLVYPARIEPASPRTGDDIWLVLTVRGCDGFFGPAHRPYAVLVDGSEIIMSLPQSLIAPGAPCDHVPYDLAWPIGSLAQGSYVLRVWTHDANSDERFWFFTGTMEFDVLESLAVPRPTAIPSSNWTTLILLTLVMGAFGAWVAVARGRAG